jgi:hypothetical protein
MLLATGVVPWDWQATEVLVLRRPLQPRTPMPRARSRYPRGRVRVKPVTAGRTSVRRDRLGGLIHEYRRKAA